jgi:hypothetical protein
MAYVDKAKPWNMRTSEELCNNKRAGHAPTHPSHGTRLAMLVTRSHQLHVPFSLPKHAFTRAAANLFLFSETGFMLPCEENAPLSARRVTCHPQNKHGVRMTAFAFPKRLFPAEFSSGNEAKRW